MHHILGQMCFGPLLENKDMAKWQPERNITMFHLLVKVILGGSTRHLKMAHNNNAASYEHDSHGLFKDLKEWFTGDEVGTAIVTDTQ